MVRICERVGHGGTAATIKGWHQGGLLNDPLHGVLLVLSLTSKLAMFGEKTRETGRT